MFKVIVRENSCVKIDGCPESGIAAVDFRRAAGLPEAPNNYVVIPAFNVESESVCRRFMDRLTENSDLDVNRVRAYEWIGNFNKPLIVKKTIPDSGRGIEIYDTKYSPPYFAIKLKPKTIVAYMREPSLETAAAIADEIIAIDAANRSDEERRCAEKIAEIEAEKAAKAAKLAAVEAARNLLADDLESGRNARRRLDIVSEFLSNVPLDALRGTLKSMTSNAGKEAFDALRDKVNEASTFVVFDD